jgi:hypothetical protein
MAKDPEADLKTSIRIKPSAWKMLRLQAVTEDRPTGAVLADAVLAYVKRKGGKT